MRNDTVYGGGRRIALACASGWCGIFSGAASRRRPPMKVQVVGCSHHTSSVAMRERLAFSPAQTAAALERLRQTFPQTEAVLLSTCNRVELYTAVEDQQVAPTHQDLVGFLAHFHGLEFDALFDE